MTEEDRLLATSSRDHETITWAYVFLIHERMEAGVPTSRGRPWPERRPLLMGPVDSRPLLPSADARLGESARLPMDGPTAQLRV